MDADFRRPKIHKFFAVDNSKGLSSVISGDAKFLDSVQRTAVEHLSVVPCGPRPRNPAELLTSPRFEQLIDSLRNQYEFVIIDTPPLLAVTDPSTVAPRVDAVLLVMRLTKTARHGMLRAAEILNSLGARVLGVVVNGVGRTSAYGYGYRYGYGRYRYGYGGYRYGYGYGNGYGYGYGSHKDGENVYYTDEKSPTPRPLGRVFNTSSKPTSAAEDSS
ncbi:MAG: hypothetical protein A2V70_04480 [Planctomycetes bacterium RBG_13_63_9]|nr:MAG: hypothetical protein A2V70_04480 [Planctomycetes bacterium RBG_13_63_9]